MDIIQTDDIVQQSTDLEILFTLYFDGNTMA